MRLNILTLKHSSYQLVPLIKILNNNLDCVLISDGVGVGKTISAGYILLYCTIKLQQSGIVVCPPSLLVKWKEELESKFNLRGSIISNDEEILTMRNELLIKSKNKIKTVYIIPNSIIKKLKFLKKIKISVIVFDEIHNFRNKETQGYENAKEISLSAKYRVGLTATPINNSLDDLISALNILLPKSSWDAISMMVDDFWNSNKKIITNSIVTRFTKENLGIHFAKREVKLHKIIYPNQYINKIKNIIKNLPSSSKNDFFEKVTYYRLASSSSNAFSKSIGMSEKLIEKDPKIEQLKKILKSINSEKWVIFCEFTGTVQALIEELEKKWEIFTMTGDTPLFARQDTIDDFRNSKKSILIMTPVGSEGLDVQFCDSIINYDLHWNPMKIEQRIGRIDRVGQKKKKIFVINMIVEGSIDQRILEVMDRKLSLISKSVFNLPPVIKENAKNKIEIFDKSILKNETEQSEKFFKALKNWTTLPLEDYSILSKINIKLCDLQALEELSKEKNPNFFKNSTKFKKWVIDTQKNSEAINHKLDLYI